jgi:hypothetical protein
LPTLIARYPPMTDLPHHETVIAILRHFNDPDWFPLGLYVRNFGHPNQMFAICGWLLSYVVSTAWACKILIAITVTCIVGFAGRLANYLGTSPWVALIVAPLALGWTFFWGLVPNLVGIATMLAVLPSLDRVAEKPTGRNAVFACLAMIALYFAHEAMMICACVAVGLFAIAQPIRIKDSLLRISPGIVAVLMFVAQQQWQKHLMTPTQGKTPTTFMSLSHKIVTLPGALLGGHEVELSYTVFGLGAAALAILIGLRIKGRTKIGWSPRKLVHHFRFEILAAILFSAYLAMPYTMSNGATLIYHRFLPPAYALFALSIAPRRGGALPRFAKLLPAAMPLGSLLIAAPEFADSDRAYRELDVLLPQIAKGSAVAELELGSDQPGRIFSMASGGARVLPERGGRLLYSLTDSPIAIAQMPVKYQWNESLQRCIFESYELRPGWDADRYRYFIAHVPGGMLNEIAKRAFLPDARFVDSSGEWMLFESTHEVIPLLSPDAPLPPKPWGPNMRKLRKRMEVAFDEMVNEAGVERPSPLPLPERPQDEMDAVDRPAKSPR